MRIRATGGLALDGASFTRPKPLLLLAYLAIEGRQDRRHVAELFWSDARDHMKSLTVALAQLRKGAPGAVSADAKQVWTDLECDVVRVLASMERSAFRAAVDHYGGPFLDGFYSPYLGAELEEWVYQTREFLAGGVRRALLAIAESEATAGRSREAGSLAEAAYALAGAKPPEPEELERLSVLLAAVGSPWLARVRDEAAEFRVDVRQSGVVTGRASRDSRAAARAVRVPSPVTAFVGRARELGVIETKLSGGDCRHLTIVGPGGVGKTRLALHVAREAWALDRFPDGICFVGLESLTDPNAIPVAVADAVGVPLRRGNDPLGEVIERIEHQALLLLVDGFEHLMDGASFLPELLKRTTRLKLLVTSRERLGVTSETVLPLEGLPCPPTDEPSVAEASRFESVMLFTQRAKRARPGYDVTRANLPYVLALCRSVDGLPLALELAASWVRLMPSKDVSVEAERSLDFLKSGARDVPERHRSVRAVLEHSWERLEEREREAMRALATFRGGFLRDAAGDVAGATIPVLASLLDRSMLRVDRSGRFDRHPLLYRFTQEKLAQNPERQADAMRRHAGYFVRLVAECRSKLTQPVEDDENEALSVLSTEYENIRAAFRWATRNDAGGALRLAASLRAYWEIRGLLQEGCAWSEEALSRADERTAPRERFAVHTTYGRFRLLQGREDLAEQQFAAALRIARSTRHPRDTAEALNLLGLLELERRDFHGAESRCRESLAIHERHGNERGIAVTLNNLGNIARAQGRFEDAAILYDRSASLHRKLGIRRSEAVAVGNHAFVALRLADVATAAALLRASLAIRIELQDEPGLAHGTFGTAVLLHEAGRHDRSAVLLGATERMMERTRITFARTDRDEHQALERALRTILATDELAALRHEGNALSREDLVPYVTVSLQDAFPNAG